MNVLKPIVASVEPGENITGFNEEQKENALLPIFVTESGIVIDVNTVHPVNALLPIVASVEGSVIVTVANAEQPSNAKLAIIVTILPIVSDISWLGLGTEEY